MAKRASDTGERASASENVQESAASSHRVASVSPTSSADCQAHSKGVCVSTSLLEEYTGASVPFSALLVPVGWSCCTCRHPTSLQPVCASAGCPRGQLAALPSVCLGFASLSSVACLPDHCSRLVTLDLSSNQLTCLAPLQPLAATLQTLLLRENHLSVLGALSTLTSLRRLDLDSNHLTSLSGMPPHMSLT